MMNNIFKKHRELLVNGEELRKAMAVLTACDYQSAKVGNCGWAKAPNVYFLFFDATNKVYNDICMKMNKYGVELLDDKVVGY